MSWYSLCIRPDCGKKVDPDTNCDHRWPTRGCFCPWCIVTVEAHAADDPALQAAMSQGRVNQYIERWRLES